MDTNSEELTDKIDALEIQNNQCALQIEKLKKKINTYNGTIMELKQEWINQEKLHKEKLKRKEAEFFSLAVNVTNVIERINKTRNMMMENIDRVINEFENDFWNNPKIKSYFQDSTEPTLIEEDPRGH